MRVVISGTHGSGKSTLIGDFAMSHREWGILPDPYELIDVAEEAPGAAVFARQLRLAAARLFEEEHPLVRRAMTEVDLLVLLPLSESDPIEITGTRDRRLVQLEDAIARASRPPFSRER